MREFEQRLVEAIELQKKRLMKVAEQMVPYITEEDLLQPNDFLELENHPFFRYEEGVLEGLQSALSALRAYIKEEQVIS